MSSPQALELHALDLQTLEWIRLLRLAEEQARTAPGRALIQALETPAHWAADLATAKLWQQETQEVIPLLDRDGLWGPLSGLADPTELLESLNRGGVLELAQLVEVRRWFYAIDSWTQTPREEIRGERLKKALLSLPEVFEPLRGLERILTPEGEISDRASPKLASLNSEIRGLKREIQVVLDSVVKTLSGRGVLQETFTDVRDGRFVVPVKISHQSEVEGTIYEASASRQTVFVEPREVALLNNRLRQRQNDLIQEIYAILEEASKRLQPYAGELGSAVAILSHWDAVQARCRLGRVFGGKTITVTDERTIQLAQTAHPLLWWAMAPDSIIRNDIEFGDPARTLLITGPNTGGKTVFLKTLGLAGICARTGFPFPATGHPQVPFFDSFFIDLGDPQSIERHLSSFSGHVLRFKSILENVSQMSLVLIDELNSATDPEEGAALGRAFLETLISRGAMTVATTHDPHLKALALTDQRILNASMAFDESARTPTYIMAFGVPGRSRALETASRLGLPEEVLALARTYLTREHLEFENLLGQLESDTQEIARSRREAVTLREEAERLKKEWTERTQASVNDLLDRTRQKLRRILETAQDEVRSSVRKLDEMRSRREIDQTRGSLNQSLSTAASQIETALKEEAPELASRIELKAEPVVALKETPALAVGLQVRVPKWKSIGKVLEVSGEKVKVALGSIQMSLSVNDIEVLPESAQAQAQAQGPARRAAQFERPHAPPSQLDLRGIRLEEAMSQLEAYLDLAFRSGGLAQVTIVHGLGTGAIREGTRKLLKQLPYIKDYRDGGAGQGGSGATVVEFERD